MASRCPRQSRGPPLKGMNVCVGAPPWGATAAAAAAHLGAVTSLALACKQARVCSAPQAPLAGILASSAVSGQHLWQAWGPAQQCRSSGERDTVARSPGPAASRQQRRVCPRQQRRPCAAAAAAAAVQGLASARARSAPAAGRSACGACRWAPARGQAMQHSTGILRQLIRMIRPSQGVCFDSERVTSVAWHALPCSQR